MKSFLERLELGDIVFKYTKRVITAFFSGLAFFLVYLIFAGFGLAIAYITHLIVNIGSIHPDNFTVPEWVRTYEPWSVGIFISALLFLAALEPWKDVIRYFRHETVEIEKSDEEEKDAGEEGHKIAELIERTPTNQAGEEIHPLSEEIRPQPSSIAKPDEKPLATSPSRRGRSNRKNPRGKNH